MEFSTANWIRFSRGLQVDYYRYIGAAKSQAETFTGQRWENLNIDAIATHFSNYDAARLGSLPAYEMCVYLRHLGFPSPLLDWSRSPYIAAFFAFESPQSDRVAIWSYQEYAGRGKLSSSDRPQIWSMGPNVTAHPRHFLQQGEYTVAVEFKNGSWSFAEHHEAINLGQGEQDRLIKVTLPAGMRAEVMRRLDRFNINAFSLMQSDDALVQTIATRLEPKFK